MRKFNPEFYLTISDIFVNLSAGWFGAVFIVPAFSNQPINLNILVLFNDILFGIIFMLTAYHIRKYAKGRKK